MALVLFLIFSVCILAVLLGGADVYKKLVDRDRASYVQRTAASFLTTKVRQSDSLDMISIRSCEGQDVLVISEEIDGSPYETWIYCYDGYARELFTTADSGLPLEAGDKVLELEGLSFRWEGDRSLGVELITPDGAVQSLDLYLRSGKEVRP